jgi:hypothetical protein
MKKTDIGNAWKSAKALLANSGYADLLAAYSYGSHVYGNARSDSDYDFIVIVPSGYTNQVSSDFVNINVFSENTHLQRIAEHEISALETLWLPESLQMIPKSYPFTLDKSKLRHSLSSKSSNSWVKAKKKLTVVQDFDAKVGKKSLWHSLRIIDFGKQIATEGKIYDYASCNHFFDEIMYHENWIELYEKYKPVYNEYLTEFRKIAPK